MAMPNGPQLRDLLIDFYTLHDPQKLNNNIDIGGIVNWTMSHGIEKLNEVLFSQYGVGLDLSKQLNTRDVMNRYTMSIDKAQMQQQLQKSDNLKNNLMEFYGHYDSSKLKGVEKLVKFALKHGEDVLNQKLFMKYRDDLSLMKFRDQNNSFGLDQGGNGYANFNAPAQQQQQNQPSFQQVQNFAPAPAPKVDALDRSVSRDAYSTDYQEILSESAPPDMDHTSVGQDQPSVLQSRIVKQESFSSADFDLEPPPPPEEDYLDPNELTSELTRFYTLVDPSKLEVIDAFVSWAQKLGRIDFNDKMIGLYGFSLDDIEMLEKEKKEKERSAQSAPQRHETTSRGTYRQPSRTEPPPNYNSRPAPPKPSFNSQPANNFLPSQPSGGFAPPKIQKTWGTSKPSSNTIQPKRTDLPDFSNSKFGYQEPKGSYEQTQQAPAPPVYKPAPVSAPAPKVKEPEPCSNYRLDMTGVSFGDCVCGHSKASHFKKKAPTAAPSTGTYRPPAAATKPPPPAGAPSNKSKPPPPVGLPPQASNDVNGKPAPPSMPHPEMQSKQVASGSPKGTACDNYRLDMTGATFGVCVCGFDRAAHKKGRGKAPVRMLV